MLQRAVSLPPGNGRALAGPRGGPAWAMRGASGLVGLADVEKTAAGRRTRLSQNAGKVLKRFTTVGTR